MQVYVSVCPPTLVVCTVTKIVTKETATRHSFHGHRQLSCSLVCLQVPASHIWAHEADRRGFIRPPWKPPLIMVTSKASMKLCPLMFNVVTCWACYILLL